LPQQARRLPAQQSAGRGLLTVTTTGLASASNARPERSDGMIPRHLGTGFSGHTRAVIDAI